MSIESSDVQVLLRPSEEKNRKTLTFVSKPVLFFVTLLCPFALFLTLKPVHQIQDESIVPRFNVSRLVLSPDNSCGPANGFECSTGQCCSQFGRNS